ncbi:MAG: hypothetical protein KKF89_04020 [Nanoarchaeota archaeon]|nr:hypothetical protein [Nanoarchaeota archaeon]MBU1854862.1 hypothetical protein [Nanoarchaeota archaeon]
MRKGFAIILLFVLVLSACEFYGDFPEAPVGNANDYISDNRVVLSKNSINQKFGGALDFSIKMDSSDIWAIYRPIFIDSVRANSKVKNGFPQMTSDWTIISINHDEVDGRILNEQLKAATNGLKPGTYKVKVMGYKLVGNSWDINNIYYFQKLLIITGDSGVEPECLSDYSVCNQDLKTRRYCNNGELSSETCGWFCYNNGNSICINGRADAPSCVTNTDCNSEFFCNDGKCIPEVDAESCADSKDNDNDGKTDCKDPDCAGQLNSNDLVCCQSKTDCLPKVINGDCFYDSTTCINGDNGDESKGGGDGDESKPTYTNLYTCSYASTALSTDKLCDESVCTANGWDDSVCSELENCNVQGDEDGDGSADCLDSDCYGLIGPNDLPCAETGADCPSFFALDHVCYYHFDGFFSQLGECSYADESVDWVCDDSVCTSSGWDDNGACPELEICDDGLDNDGDDDIDYSDSDCTCPDESKQYKDSCFLCTATPMFVANIGTSLTPVTFTLTRYGADIPEGAPNVYFYKDVGGSRTTSTYFDFSTGPFSTSASYSAVGPHTAIFQDGGEYLELDTCPSVTVSCTPTCAGKCGGDDGCGGECYNHCPDYVGLNLKNCSTLDFSTCVECIVNDDCGSGYTCMDGFECCKRNTCSDLGYTCGTYVNGDDCGGTLDCGVCACADGLDNDGDGKKDLADPHCSSVSDNSEVGDSHDKDDDGHSDVTDCNDYNYRIYPGSTWSYRGGTSSNYDVNCNGLVDKKWYAESTVWNNTLSYTGIMSFSSCSGFTNTGYCKEPELFPSGTSNIPSKPSSCSSQEYVHVCEETGTSPNIICTRDLDWSTLPSYYVRPTDLDGGVTMIYARCK